MMCKQAMMICICLFCLRASISTFKKKKLNLGAYAEVAVTMPSGTNVVIQSSCVTFSQSEHTSQFRVLTSPVKKSVLCPRLAQLLQIIKDLDNKSFTDGFRSYSFHQCEKIDTITLNNAD